MSNMISSLASPGMLAMTLGGVDMSILATIAPPDPEAQRKYEAMGLPDPVAFAALTALGAIPNPMELLNAMMLAAQDRIDGEAVAVSVAPQAPAVQEPALAAAAPRADAAAAASPHEGCAPVPRLSGMPTVEAPGLGKGTAQHGLAATAVRGPGGLAVPPGKSFVEAFHELQRRQEQRQDAQQQPERPVPAGPLSGYAAAAQRARGQQLPSEADAVEVEKLEERLAKSAKELAEQAKVAADRAKEVAQTAAQTATANRDASSAVDPEAVRTGTVREGAAARGVAQVFSSGADDDLAEDQQLPPRATSSMQTLSSLLTGRQGTDAVSALAVTTTSTPTLEKICISRLPQGVTESAVRLECARHGAVTSVILEADGSAAYVSFAAPDMAATAVRRITGRVGVLGSTTEPVQVRLISKIPDSVRLAALPAPPVGEPVDPVELPEYLRPREDRKRRGSRTKRRRQSQRRRRQRKSRSMVRWLDRSRSNSHTATGQYIRATGCSSTVRWWEKKRESSSSSTKSSRSQSRRRKADDDPSSRRPRQVAVKGNWAQFVQSGMSYYYNVLTGQTTWERPIEFDAGPSRRPSEGTAASGCSGTRGSAPRVTGALL